MEKRILDYMRKHHMIREGDVVCVGCSGGADSLFLLLFLWELSAGRAGSAAAGQPPAFTLCACHVDHMLRGEASDADRRFVETFCLERGIPLYIHCEDVARAAEEAGTGLEEAGRAVRREAFRRCMREHGVTKIALAHHADDQAETVLFQLARGSALAGMAGMRPVQGQYIRPLLGVRAGEIREALTKRSIIWREDQSNESDDYSRNRIRHRILPALEEEINSGAVYHLSRAAEHAAQAEDFLRAEAKKRAAAYVKVPPDEPCACIIREEFGREPLVMRKYIVMEILEALCGQRKDLTARHVEQILELQAGRTGREVMLPHGIRARSEYGSVRLGAAKPEPRGTEERQEVRIQIGPGENAVWQMGKWLFRGRLISAAAFRRMNPGETIPDKTYTKWLDYDKIKGTLIFRTRRPGDYLVIGPGGRRQKIKEYMINRKIPREERDVLPLLAGGQEVYWVVGGRIGVTAEVTEKTGTVLEIIAQRR